MRSVARSAPTGPSTLGHCSRSCASVIGHELRTPLAVVESAAQTAISRVDSLTVSGDPTALREIVFNVLANAAKYSAPHAAIEVTVRQDDDRAEVIVRDHGTGVTPRDTETIFGKFLQGDRASPGAGLGLYISRGLARAHGGDLHVRPAEQRGSEFILTLPA